MASFLKKFHHSHADAQIHLSPKSGGSRFNTSPDHFLSNETVNGYAQIQMPHGTVVSHSKVILKGAVKTSTDEQVTGAFSKSWRTERQSFLGVQFPSKARNTSPNEEGIVQIPFHFDLNECERLSSLTSGLAPSLDSKTERQRASEYQFDVTYSISVTAYSSKGALASATQKIYVLPVSPAILSERHSDVPNEHFWAQPAIKQPSHHGATDFAVSSEPRIEIAGEEPDPIIFNPYEAPKGSTEVPFILKIVYPDADSASKAAAPAQCQIKARLVTKTHLTPDGKHLVGLDSQRFRDAGPRITKTHISHEQENIIPISNWEPCISCPVDPFSVAKFSFPFSVREDQPLTPTFSTSLLSRDYSIDLTLSFPGYPQQNSKLSLAVEVVHGTPESRPNDSLETANDSSGAEAHL